MKALKWLLFLLYCAALTYLVFFARRRSGMIWHDDLVHLVPIKSSIDSFQSGVTGYWNFFSNLFGNVLLFVPLPFFLITLFRIYSRMANIVAGLFVSTLIEIGQYAWRIGVPDIDDVLLNVFGVVLGYYLCKKVIGNIYQNSALL